ncbi:MAG: DUF2892 domain-containing protein [Pirellulales bacterium]|nr:DUF2892 domain-containing protein [Pirellulales bacterium]
MPSNGGYNPNITGQSTTGQHHGAPSRYSLTSHACAALPNVGDNERLVSSLVGACLAAVGLSSNRKGSWLLAGLGGALVYRGMTGHCHMYDMLGMNTARRGQATAVPSQHGYKVERSITVNAPAAELYSFWREVENLPKVMSHVKRVEVLDRDRSHWVAEGALGKSVEWDAEIFNDVENEMIAWRSLPGGDVDTAGSVHFRALGENHGTVVTVSMKYDPPAGKVGAWIAALTGSGLEKKLDDDLRRFKQSMDSAHTPGSVQTSGLQPAGDA